MGWQGKRGAALASLLAAFAFALSACGGNDSSNESASSSDAGSQAATGPTGSTGATGIGGATDRTGSAQSGGSKTPSTTSKGATGKSSPTSSDTSGKRTSKKRDQKPVGLDNPDAGILANFYSQAREVCKILTLPGLAHEYEVAETPDAVAKAYSKSYPKNQRRAVYRGCRDGVS